MCHVICAFNKFRGIGSLRRLGACALWKTEWSAFKPFTPVARTPHPAFVRVPDVPERSNVSAYATEFTVTPEAIDDLLAFVKTIEKLDLSQMPVINGVGPSGRQRLFGARIRGKK